MKFYTLFLIMALQGCGDESGENAALVEEKKTNKVETKKTVSQQQQRTVSSNNVVSNNIIVEEEEILELELANTAPVFDAIDDVVVDENTLAIINLTAHDAEGDALTYSCIANCDLIEAYIGLVDGVEYEKWSLGASTGLFSWIPTYFEAGDYDLTFEVSDGELTNEVTVRLSVTDINRPPYFFNFPPTATIAQNATYNRTMQATDSDGGTMTVSLLNVIPNASLTGNAFSFTPDGTQSGEFTFDFQVSDGELTSQRSLTILVSAVNQAPVLAAIGAKSVKESEELTFEISATDGNGDSITYSATGLPAGASLTGNVFAWTPTCAQEGNYSVTFSATDGSATSSEIVNISVLHKNCGLPVWMSGTSIVSSSGNQVVIDIGMATDSDGVVSYGFVKEYDCNNKNWTQSLNVATRRITITNTYGSGDYGSHWFLVFAQDSDGNRVYRMVKATGSNVEAFTSGYVNGSSTVGICGANKTVYNHN